MAKLNLSVELKKPTVEIDPRVVFQITPCDIDGRNNSKAIAKVQIIHPAFTTVATVWKQGTRHYVTTPSLEGKDSNDKTVWYPMVDLKDEVRDHIAYIVANGEGTQEPWYIQLQGLKDDGIVNGEISNDSLGIEGIVVNDGLTDAQAKSEMLCKATIMTSIGNLYSYTIWASKFGTGLYGSVPTDRNSSRENRKNSPAYTLTSKAIANILGFLHSQTDFTVETTANRTSRAAVAASANGTAGEDVPAFQPMEDEDVMDAIEA